MEKILKLFGFVPATAITDERRRIQKVLENLPQWDCGCCNTDQADWEDVICDSVLDHVEVGDVLTYPNEDFELLVTGIYGNTIKVKDEIGFETGLYRDSGYVSSRHSTDRAGWGRV